MKRSRWFALLLVFGMPFHEVAFGESFRFPSPGALVVGADSVLSGRLADDKSNVFLKNGSDGQGEVRVRAIPRSIFFDLRRLVRTLGGANCFVIGKKEESGILLEWGDYSVWPRGIVGAYPNLDTVEKCSAVIDNLLFYKRLSANDETQLCKVLLADSQTSGRDLAVVLFLASDVPCWKGRKQLWRDVVCAVGMQMLKKISAFDGTSVDYTIAFSSFLPPSVSIPKLLDAARKGGARGEKAKHAVLAMLRVRCLLGQRDYSIEDIDEIFKVNLPELRRNDAKRWIALFDSSNRELRAKAPLVFSMILNLPRPVGLTTEEERRHWLDVWHSWQSESSKAKGRSLEDVHPR